MDFFASFFGGDGVGFSGFLATLPFDFLDDFFTGGGVGGGVTSRFFFEPFFDFLTIFSPKLDDSSLGGSNDNKSSNFYDFIWL